MGQRRSEYERAFEAHLRETGTPYVSVNEARRALLPEGAGLRLQWPEEAGPKTLKTFDFVVYGPRTHLLVDVKGRKIGSRRASGSCSPGRLESWVTEDDVASMGVWESIFGDGFRAAFVFLYRCQAQPPAALFQEVFEHQGRWFAVRAVWMDLYKDAMRTRSARWRTVHIPTEAFERISQPLCGVIGPGTRGEPAGPVHESMPGQSLQAPTRAVSSL
jgi:hypothetical protein